MFTRVLHASLVHGIDIHKGSQWVLHNPTLVVVCAYNGPLVYTIF